MRADYYAHALREMARSQWVSCLIADVVTGKLDVRKAAAGLTEVDLLAAEREPTAGVGHDAGSDPTGDPDIAEAGGPIATGGE